MSQSPARAILEAAHAIFSDDDRRYTTTLGTDFVSKPYLALDDSGLLALWIAYKSTWRCILAEYPTDESAHNFTEAMKALKSRVDAGETIEPGTCLYESARPEDK